MSSCSDTPTPLAAAGPALRTTAEVAQPLDTVRARIFTKLQGPEVPLQVLSHPELGPQFDNFILYTNEKQRIDYNFRHTDTFNVSDDVPMNLGYEPPATITPALRVYIALPSPARAADLFMQRGPGPFWPVPEYRSPQGQPLPYTCDHIIHFTALASGGTQLEIITLDSRILDGKEWRLDVGHDGLSFPWPRRMPRSRDVPPSTADQQQVLAQLVKLGEG